MRGLSWTKQLLVRKGLLMSEAVGVIVAAIIAGVVAFFSLIISKEQTVSDFRQQWIDELRKDIAAVVACVSGIHGGSSPTRQRDEERQSDLIHFKEVVARIRLRLNPEEKRKNEGPATKAVLGTLMELESTLVSKEPDFHKLESSITTLVTNANVILKENWQRVRSGEPIYQVTKWLTLGFTVAVVIAVLLHVFKAI